MRKLILIGLLCSTWNVLAAGPKYNFSDPKLTDEFVNAYKDIGTLLKATPVRISSATISSARIANLNVTGTLTTTAALGKLAQVIFSSSTSDITTTSGVFTPFPSSGTITPSATTSNIVVIVCGVAIEAGSGQNINYTVTRNGTNICSATQGCGYTQTTAAVGTGIGTLICMTLLDSPSSTSAVKYSVSIKSSGGSVEFGSGAPVDFVLMEISG